MCDNGGMFDEPHAHREVRKMLKSKISFVKGMKDFFGDHPTNPNLKFIGEMKELTPQDKQEFREMLIGLGYDITPLGS